MEGPRRVFRPGLWELLELRGRQIWELRRKILVVGRRDLRNGCDVAGFRQLKITTALEAMTLATLVATIGNPQKKKKKKKKKKLVRAAPQSYDHGVNVVYEGNDVYVDGKREASAQEFSEQAITLANTSEKQPPAPMPPEDGKQAEYLPLGVWAMVPGRKGRRLYVLSNLDRQKWSSHRRL